VQNDFNKLVFETSRRRRRSSGDDARAERDGQPLAPPQPPTMPRRPEKSVLAGTAGVYNGLA
jgi:hypothetical protein